MRGLGFGDWGLGIGDKRAQRAEDSQGQNLLPFGADPYGG